MPDPRPLFVCGCARSGTTALARLLGSHPAVLLGSERYAKLALDTFAITPGHLTPARFARIHPGDTFYDSFSGRYLLDPHFNDKIGDRLELAYIGDKKPRLFLFWREIFERFPEARLIFVYRDPLDVAYSWERRARTPGGNWPPGRDAAAAISEWNLATACIRDAVAQGESVAVFSYEGLLSPGWTAALFDWLGLKITREVHAAAEKLRAGHERALMARPGDGLALHDDALYAEVDSGHAQWLESVRCA